MKITEAVILAGGLGTRLRDAVPDLPKCMAPVAGKPFLHYVISHYKNQGIQRFILALGYKHEIITDFIESEYSNLEFDFSIEEEALGTGGAIRLACNRAVNKTVVALNGDTLYKVALDKLSGFHEMAGADCTLSLKPMHQFSRYGVVELNKDYSIKSFREKMYYEQGLINGGVYALHVKRFLAEELPSRFSFEKDYLEALYQQKRMFGVMQDEYFIDIGIPEDFRRAQTELPANMNVG